jgi:hypothetical protein
MAALHVMKETFCALITFFSLEMYSLYTDEWIVSLFDNVAGYKAKKALTCLRLQQADISLPDRGPPVLCCTPGVHSHPPLPLRLYYLALLVLSVKCSLSARPRQLGMDTVTQPLK